uniref:uncharacterized protein LOC120346237 n=1 Tax=Styela clava TaxID=7725 RepID=UPI001939CBA8|nr:uncharacterized protein LOC120346237 [Styela clava]
MDFRIILVFVLLGEIAVSETTKMRMWERRCLVTHNKIRSNRGIGAVSRSALLTEKADLKGLHLVLNEYKIHIAGLADINSSLLQKERISFSTEILSKTLLFPRSPNARDFRMQLYLSLAAEDMIMKWVENGLFSLDNKERYDRMMDPSVDKIGCALHYVPVQGNVYKIYVVVAYQLNEKNGMEKVKKFHWVKIAFITVEAIPCQVVLAKLTASTLVLVILITKEMTEA